jgi:TonB family protein
LTGRPTGGSMAPMTKAIRASFAGSLGKGFMRLSLAVSIAIHLAAFVAFKDAFTVDWLKEPLRTYQVELIRPPLDQIEKWEEQAAGLDKAKDRPNPPPAAAEDTISLDTRDAKYVPYAKIVRARLLQNWDYPASARENLIEGKLLVLFTLTKEGQLADFRILEPSGARILDEEALRTIRAAAPFPPFPASLGLSKLHIKARFEYQLRKRS